MYEHVFVQSTNLKGAIAEAEVTAAATRLGIPVLRPVAEHGRYDLALDVGTRLLRVQCKCGTLDQDGAVIKVNLASSWLSPTGYVRTTYSTDEIDAVAVYCAAVDRCYLLPSQLAAGRRAIYLRLKPPRNQQRACINLAGDFDFSGAVAQLGERLAGSEEARGSSPLSSTSRRQASRPDEIGAHRFREHLGYYLERAAAGESVVVTRRGKPLVQLLPAAGSQSALVAA